MRNAENVQGPCCCCTMKQLNVLSRRGSWRSSISHNHSHSSKKMTPNVQTVTRLETSHCAPIVLFKTLAGAPVLLHLLETLTTSRSWPGRTVSAKEKLCGKRAGYRRKCTAKRVVEELQLAFTRQDADHLCGQGGTLQGIGQDLYDTRV